MTSSRVQPLASKTIREEQEQLIRQYGRAVIGVFPDEDSSDATNDFFCYSLGNALKSLPELLVVGMSDGRYPINELSEIMLKRGCKFDDGEKVSLGGRYSLQVFDASDEVKDRFTIQATNYLGHRNYEVQQVVIPDQEGRFPWQSDCAPPYGRIKIFRRQ